MSDGAGTARAGSRRVLVADDMESMTALIRHLLEARGYTVAVAADGEECLKQVDSFAPDLLILDIMMPKAHGLDVLRALNQRPHRPGVVVCTSRQFKSDEDQIRGMGVTAVITKPFNTQHLVATVDGYFSAEAPTGESAPAPTAQQAATYAPTLDMTRPHVRFWGTRGSIPVSGSRYARYGGNTACVSVHYGDDVLILDAGSGLRELGLDLAQRGPRPIHLFVTHTHWDHIQGFPFFVPAYVAGFDLSLYAASGFGKDLKSVFGGQLDRDYFPVQLEDMRAGIRFCTVNGADLQLGPFRVSWEFAHHPGATLAYRIEVGGRHLAYVPDNEFLAGFLGDPSSVTADGPELAPYARLVSFLSGLDLLVAEAQYTTAEYARKTGWGHSSLPNACRLVQLAQTPRWIITHHDPADDDDQLDAKGHLARQLLHDMGCPTQVSMAYDGMVEYLV
jgi:CheY-like chemotaxis protein/phosphoribosyl 1,2-cyclic phosphodiesterase